MCRAVRCRKCNKTTWAGCGAHVQQVMGPVPPDQRCRCGDKGEGETPSDESSGGFFFGLFKKRQ
jgi:hypothetical protein